MAALIRVLNTLRDEAGETTVAGVLSEEPGRGAAYPQERFRSDAGVLDEVDVIGGGAVADALWARPVATVLAIEGPAVKDVTASVQAEARAVVNLRVPSGVDAADAQRRLVEQLTGAVPWNARISGTKTLGRPFAARTDGTRIRRPGSHDGGGVRPADGAAGQGGAILLCVTCWPSRRPRSCSSGWRSRPAGSTRRTRASTRRSAGRRWRRPYCYAPSAPDAARSGPNAYRHAFARMGWPLGYSKSCSPSRTNPRRRQSPLDGRFVTFG